MKIAEIRTMNDEQLRGAELNARQALFEARMSRATGELSNVMKVRMHRRDLARIITISHERARVKES
jgi:ribosomal protein L29